jgi:hypothetical protein
MHRTSTPTLTTTEKEVLDGWLLHPLHP